MSLEEKRRLILAFDVLIRSKVPGRAEYLAKRLGVSRSTFFRLIEYMREELYAPVIFDADKNRYAYESEGIVMFRFLPAEIIDVEKAKE
jgi:predicted DNA-binding transcriptional regulator YafY